MDATTGLGIARLELNERFTARFRHRYAVVHRGDLYGVLLNACQQHPRIALRPSSEVAGFEQDASCVKAILASGERVEGRALIGADGLHSNVRRQLVGDQPPRVSGHTTYRAVIPAQSMPAEFRWNAAALWAGPRCHLVHYPLSGWRTFNLVATYQNDATEPVAGVPVEAGEVHRGFEHVSTGPRSILERGTQWRKWVLCDREPDGRWVRGRVALLGDAAHPMLQYFAQGACMALEDAVVLGEALRAYPDIEVALARYRDRRVLRTARVQVQSRLIGEHVYHPSGTHAALRNALMGARSQDEWLDVFDWIYGDGATSPF